jgi:transposase
LRTYARKAEVDAVNRPGLTTEERNELKRPHKENRELKRANDILQAAAVFFGAELDLR